MTVSELVNECLQSLGQGCERMTLTMPKVPKRFPRGELVAVTHEGLRVMRYDIMKVLGYLAKHKVIEVSRKSDKTLQVKILQEVEPTHDQP